MKTTHFIASGIASIAFLAAIAAPSLASAQQYIYPTSYSYYTVSTPYNCGGYWSSQPCTYASYTSPVYQYSYPSYNYSYPQYQTYPYQYQNQWYGNRYNYGYGYNNSVCPVGYYLWGQNCWPNPSTNNVQFWYPAY